MGFESMRKKENQSQLLYGNQLALPRKVGVMLAGTGGEQAEVHLFSLLLPSSLQLAPLLAEPNMDPAGKGARDVQSPGALQSQV